MADAAKPTTSQLIAALWERNQPVILERLAQLDRAAAAARAGLLSEEIRAEAESTAHKLSGSLGMFGFALGTEHARAIEDELRTESPNAERLAELAIALRAALYPSGS